MEVVNLAELISNYGMSFVLMAYFLYKDFKFNQQILDTLGAINTVLTKLETWHAREDNVNERV